MARGDMPATRVPPARPAAEARNLASYQED